MQLLRKYATFTTNEDELKNIYILFVISILEQSIVIWHSSLTIEEFNILERVKKSTIKNLNVNIKNINKVFQNNAALEPRHTESFNVNMAFTERY